MDNSKTYIDRNGQPKELFTVIAQDDFYMHKGKVPIIKLRGIKKLCDSEGIVEKDFRTEIQPTEGNKQQHAVNVWVGFTGETDKDKWRRGSGEASILNTGRVVHKKNKEEGKPPTRAYEEFGEIDSMYRYAMADKRAFSRAVLNLVQLHDVYSEIEARDFVLSPQNPSSPSNAGASVGADISGEADLDY